MLFNKKINIIFSLIFILSTLVVFSQEIKTNKNVIKVLARPHSSHKIMLRWGATTPISFRKLAKYGYRLKRYTISISGQTLSKPIEKDLGVFKPAELQKWIDIIEKNNNAAIMAQSLFGESFDVEGVGSLQGIINMSQEQEQRFTWALYVADQDFEVAKLAGLGFEDLKVKSTEKYVYKVFSLVPKEEMKIKDGGVFVGLQDYQNLPKPLDLAAIFDDQKVMLNWNYAIHKNEFNSYFIERSEDGINFNELNKLPYTTLNSGGRVDTKRIYYTDSIQNNKTYYYRVKGRTPFGELSPPSEVISGKGVKVLPYVPKISSKKIVNNNKSVVLEWKFLEEGVDFIKGFELNKSNKANGQYETVVRNISRKIRKVKYDKLDATNYFTITAIGKQGNSRTSYPVLVQPVDSIPPVKPVGLEGEVDSLGVVTLKWKKNIEPDMLGYRVFKGNNVKEEFSQITVSPHHATTFYDSVSVKSLNNKVYYKIVAVDKRYNMSEYSDVLILKKPDFIPPAPPVITSYNVEKETVNLTWANSQSNDIAKHEVYRRVRDSIKWNLIATLPKDTLHIEYTDWKDTNVEGNTAYQYLIKAVDESDLQSINTKHTTIEVPRFTLLKGLKNLGSYVDRGNNFIELFWKTVNKEAIVEIMIYKGKKDEKVSLLKNVLPSTNRIVDENVKPNNIYTYILRPVFIDGSMGQIKKIEVKY
ncbi:fibronectin type III domain-containing protein [Tenacibaculum sp. IMCC1]|uniref:Fibronectin type-III domain-containing protein n=1 Tax=Tenacibaculum sp. Pbs-1 TaxID=3238748 RepID=A0AB33KUM6_9FLAO